MSEITAWILFNLFILCMLALDLGVFHRQKHVVSMREAAIWSCIWVALSLLFALGVYYRSGSEASLNFLAGYLIELSLSVDNLFVFLLIFSYFKVPENYLHKVLFWGIVGAIAMRALFIFCGIALIAYFHWMFYLFGAFLVFTAIKLAFEKEKKMEPEKNPLVVLLKHFIPVTATYVEDKFFVKKDGVTMATPLFLVLIVIETTDIIFAVDSIPAILAITLDPFIVYTSNMFAILGLRSLFFLLSRMMQIFHHIHYGLAAILLFIGFKMLLADFFKVPIPVTLGVIAALLGISIIASILDPKDEGQKNL